MKTAEEILKETLNLKGEITEKDYWMTVKVKDCLEAINKALAISRVVGRSEQLPCAKCENGLIWSKDRLKARSCDCGK